MAHSTTLTLTCFLLVCLAIKIDGMEVYLRQVKVYTTHESNFINNSPEVYLLCQDDRDPILLRQVVDVDKNYNFGSEQKPVTHVEHGECVTCTLMEFDLFDADDTFGKMELCAENFKTGVSEVEATGEFYARFDCPVCKTYYDQIREDEQAETKAKAEARDARSYVQTNAVDVAPSSDSVSVKKGTSTVGVVFISLAVFIAGAVIGAITMRHFASQRQKLEAARMHELNSVLAQTDIPYDNVPKGPARREVSVRAGTYHSVPTSEDTR